MPLDAEQGYHGPLQRIILELKVVHASREKTIELGLAQITGYAVRCRADECHLVLFDRSVGVVPEAKLFEDTRKYEGRTIMVWGL